MIKINEIDKDFRLLIKELNRVGLKTTQCCSGHKGKKLAYLSISLKDIQDVAVRNEGKRLVLWWNRKGRKKNITNW